MQKFKVTFFPDNKVIRVEKDKTILSAAISAGIYLNSNCAGDGTCGKCKVKVNSGQVKSQANGIITAKDRENKVYLACLTTIQSDLEILIPDSSRIDADIQTDSIDGDNALESVDSLDKNFGFCFDIGTTTISGQLINLNSKKIIGTKTAYNQQIAFGSDVITRIVYAAKTDGLEKLHTAVIDTMNQIINDLVNERKVDLNNVNSIVCSGNTTMMHLLLNMDPAHLRRQPYIARSDFMPVLNAVKVGININPQGLLSCVPGVSNYVGGDTTAGILSSGIYQEEKPCILIDIGTNGEIVLGNRDFLIASAASAGPAFEGSGVTSGMRASGGAIQKLNINKNDFSVKYSTIYDKLPQGICGSGYIDLLSEMLKSGIIDRGGKIKVTGKRIRSTENGKEFVVCFKEEIKSQADIVINEADIENLKRSKGAIYSACAILVKHLALEFSAIAKIFIAGGFGTYLDIQKAIQIGLLPDLERSKFIFIGNSSLAGSREILLSAQAKSMSDTLASKITYFDLSADSGYMEEYGQALFFPHTDLAKFPTVRY